MNLVEALHRHAQEIGSQAAIVDCCRGRDRVVSFRDLATRVDQVAEALHRLGFVPGDRVLVFHPVAIELYVFLLGCFQKGVVVVLADPSGGEAFLSRVCKRVSPKGFFGSRKAHLLRWAKPSLRATPIAMHPPRRWWPGSRLAWNVAAEVESSIHPVDHGGPALITFTSGSTGEPKGVVRSHGFLLDQHQALESALKLQQGEVDLVTLPVFALANLASGLTSVIADGDLGKPGEVDGRRILAQCQRWKVSRVTAAPAFLEKLLAEGCLPAWEQVFTGGAPVFPDLIRRMAQQEPDVQVTAVYGSTEAEPVAEFPSQAWTEEVDQIIRSGGGLPAGKPVCQVAVLEDRFGEEVSGAAFENLKLDVGKVGEIVVAGPQVLQGYLDGKGDEETKIPVGKQVWHRTGDAGWLDEQGCLWLVGRCQARMRSEKGFIYPLAIEAALRLSFPGRKTAALEHGNEIILVVEGDASADLGEKAKQLGCMRVTSLSQLPMDHRHQSKIDYPELRRALAAANGERFN